MPSDDLSSQEPGTHFTSEGPRLPGREADELDEAAERLESASWDPFEDEPLTRSGAQEAGVHPQSSPGQLRSFLEQQLQHRPLPTLLAAVAAGWLVGKLLR